MHKRSFEDKSIGDRTLPVWPQRFSEGIPNVSLVSEDGARLRVDDKTVINNDGVHAAVDYFRGPRFTVALVLAIARPGDTWRVFNTNGFKPPNDPAQWKQGTMRLRL